MLKVKCRDFFSQWLIKTQVKNTIEDGDQILKRKFVNFKYKFFEEKNQNFHYAESFINPHLLSFFQPPELI